MIIDATDFRDRPYKVPNQEESRDFISFLDITEEELAVKYLLGYELWSLLETGLATSGTIDPIYARIRDGGVYTKNGKQYLYKGWVDMIRPGLYSLWAPLGTDKFTNVGIVQNTPKESKVVEDQYPFHVKPWNEFVSKVGYGYPYSYNCEGSFYGFMQANKEDYPSWRFSAPALENRHDF